MTHALQDLPIHWENRSKYAQGQMNDVEEKISRSLEGGEFPRSREGGRTWEEAARRRWDLSWAFRARWDDTGREEACIPGRGSISFRTPTSVPCFASNFRGVYEPHTVSPMDLGVHRPESRCPALAFMKLQYRVLVGPHRTFFFKLVE